MNNLSWLIYLAEAVDKVGTLTFVAAFVSGMCGAFAGVSGNVEWACYSSAEHDKNEEKKRKLRKLSKGLLCAMPFLALTSALIPSSKTVYLVATSEVGEAVATTPDAVEMMGDLKDIIKKRLKEELVEDKK